MGQYIDVFNATSINRTLFFKILTVTEFGDTSKFMEHNESKYDIWAKMAMDRYENASDETYLTKGCYLPEFSKIVGVAYGTLTTRNGDYNRQLKFIRGVNEEETIEQFFHLINQLPSVIQNPLYCGHNITGYDIPFLIKRALKHNIKVPELLKECLSKKPWESNVLDTLNLWKFNGSDYISLKLISTFLELKYKEIPTDLPDFNIAYWRNNFDNNELEFIKNEGFNQINLTMQLMRKLREM